MCYDPAVTYSGVMVVQKTVTDKLQCDGRLADTAVAEYHNLVDSEAA